MSLSLLDHSCLTCIYFCLDENGDNDDDDDDGDDTEEVAEY